MGDKPDLVCEFCEGIGVIYCGGLPPLECPRCLGCKKDPAKMRAASLATPAAQPTEGAVR